MAAETFERSVELPAPVERAFAWHERAGAFERLLPPWEKVEILERRGTIRDGDALSLRMRLGPLWLPWLAVHRDYVANRRFCDEQVKGPLARWVHRHGFEAVGERSSRMTDRVEYALPLGRLGEVVAGAAVRRRLDAVFAYRHRITRGDMELHERWADRPRLTVAVSGASGLVGRQLTALLSSGGHRVLRLVRGQPGGGADRIAWDPASGFLEPQKLEGVDAVVHLAGENLAGYWSQEKMAEIRNSRVVGTRVLSESLAKLTHKPSVLVCASAVGYYGSRGEEKLDDTAGPGDGFLAAVCRQWEEASAAAQSAGIRTAHLRLGVVLDPRGGALKLMLRPFKLGLAGVLGPGTQWMAWVSLDDVVSAMCFCLMEPSVSGALNVASPHPVTNRGFTKTLGNVLARPTIARVPTVALMLLGDMGEEMLLASQRVVPRRLSEAGFEFRDPELDPALRRMLGRLRPSPVR